MTSPFSTMLATVLTMSAKRAIAERRGRAQLSAKTRPVTRLEAKQRTRRRLLGAARRLILAGGESRLSARIVAPRAGGGGATVFEQFPKPDELLPAPSGGLFYQ